MIVGELTPENISRLVADVTAKGEIKTRSGLVQVARVVESEAKKQLGQSTHRYGEPTGASPGGPPALISGTLRRSVTHSASVLVAGAWETKVGTAAGLFPTYSHRTPSSKYGKYLETGLRNGAKYPWLMPAFKLGVASVGASFIVEFRKGW